MNRIDWGRHHCLSEVARTRKNPIIARIAYVLAFLSLTWITNSTHATESKPVSKPTPGIHLNPQEKTSLANPERDVPQAFLDAVSRRRQIDNYSSKVYRFESLRTAGSTRPSSRRQTARRSIRKIDHSPPLEVSNYRQSLTANSQQLTGFRAPILENAEELTSIHFAPPDVSEDLVRAKAYVEESLAEHGLLRALIHLISVLGPNEAALNPEEIAKQLELVGYPVDLLPHFEVRWDGATLSSNLDFIRAIGRARTKKLSTDEVQRVLDKARFTFIPTNAQFRAEVESGDHAIGMIRIQIGGGINEGILRGGSIDLATQLIQTLPEVKIVATVPQVVFEIVHWMARFHWPLRSRNQLTLISDSAHVSPWAQDNGKAGYLITRSGNRELATLTPRYASKNEYPTELSAKESFLMDGIARSGHKVLHSPLLFQGGNLLVVRDPGSHERILLVGEAEVYRNIELGLTYDQALSALQTEFSVDRCSVLPMASFHIDFDLTCRAVDDRLVVFVNDSMEAARMVVKRGLIALTKAELLSANNANQLHSELISGYYAGGFEQLNLMVRRPEWAAEHGDSLSNHFSNDALDSPQHNFRLFMTALDLIECRLPKKNEVYAPRLATYLKNLKGLINAENHLQSELSRQGFEVIRVPSMPGLFADLNYLNGVHDKDIYLMPAIGGFYTSVDQAAGRVIQARLGLNVKVVPILCSDLIRHHGALHCAVSAYRRL